MFACAPPERWRCGSSRLAGGAPSFPGRPCVWGAQVVREAYPDDSQWDKSSKYHDPTSTRDAPRWFMVDVRLVRVVCEWGAPSFSVLDLPYLSLRLDFGV